MTDHSDLFGIAPHASEVPDEVGRTPRVRYAALPAREDSPPAKRLVAIAGSTTSAGPFEFFDQIEVGRDEEGRDLVPGQLLVDASHISGRHCLVTQNARGRCYVRDVSRNGTRVNGRRLMPNVEAELHVGQTLDLGAGLQFLLDGESDADAVAPKSRKRTSVQSQLTLATVMVGDIRDYTMLVRQAPSTELQRAVSRVFQHLTAFVEEAGGTVKEFPGDAILAFWEGGIDGRQAITACRAAVQLELRVRQIAADRSIWSLADFPLKMDWALATGGVVIDSFGGETPVGLSMVGEPIVLASRLEKFANDETGSILTCRGTRDMALRALPLSPGEPLLFRDLGPMQAKGFERPESVFALQVPEVA